MKKTRVRRTLLLANYFHIFGISMLAPVYALYGLHIGATPWVIGSSWGLYNLVAGVMNIITGKFEDGPQRSGMLIVLGYSITVVAMALLGLVTKPNQLYLIQTLTAVGVGIYMPAWKKLFAESQDKHHVASEWGMFDGGNMIVMALAAVLAGYVVGESLYLPFFLIILASYSMATIVALRLRAYR